MLPPTSPSAVRRIGVSTQIKISPATRPTGADLIEFDQFTPDVSDGNVAFLDAGGVCSRHCDGNVGRPCEETAILAGKTDGFEVLLRGLCHRRQHVGGIAACAEADGDVACRASASICRANTRSKP